MSISSKVVVGLVVAAFTAASAGALAGDQYGDTPHDARYDDRYDGRYDPRDDGRQDGGYDYAKVIDVQPLTRRVRVTTPQRECWDETRYDDRGRNNGPLPRSATGGTLLGAVIGAAIGNQIGSGDGRRAATAAGAIIGAGIGRNQAERRQGYASVPSRSYTVERCDVRYDERWEERVDGYKVTYVYNGRRQVTELPYRPGDRIRVRVDVSPAE